MTSIGIVFNKNKNSLRYNYVVNCFSQGHNTFLCGGNRAGINDKSSMARSLKHILTTYLKNGLKFKNT